MNNSSRRGGNEGAAPGTVRLSAPARPSGAEEKLLRLQVVLAHSGAASRRAAEALIAGGRVSVNGKTVTTPGTKVRSCDEVALDGKPVAAETRIHYLALNKPPEYLCSASDSFGRRLVLELLPPEIPERLYNVGRLDYLSSGLLFITNDGGFAARLGHPSSGIEKEYEVESTVPVPDAFTEEFTAGVLIEGQRYKALKAEKTGKKSLRIVLVEGKNREIRRVFSHFHLHLQLLRRIRIGPVLLGNLEEGKTRPLTETEVRLLYPAAPSGNTADTGGRGNITDTGGMPW
ncbi:MAG: rRNA pseudouridine synthase [Treponema sp.]|nr:rRNA pseudouridine synthase [Treponema sp.]